MKTLIGIVLASTMTFVWMLSPSFAAAGPISLEVPAYLGARVTFTVTTPSTGSIQVLCYQSTTKVWGTTQKAATSFLLGGSNSTWIKRGGSASCTATWFQIKKHVRTTLGTLSFVAGATSPTSTSTATTTTTATSTPTETTTATTPPPPPGTPVVLVVLENATFSQVAGSAPWLNGAAARGRLFTNYTAITHPSLPNYIAFSSGGIWGCTNGSTCGANSLGASSFYGQLESAGISWASYAENMTTNCQGTDSGSGSTGYIAHHQPVVYFKDVHAACLSKSLPLTRLDPAALPAFSYIEPSNVHNLHDGTIQQSDTWLGAHLQPLIDAGAEVIVTFDEGVGTDQTIYTLATGAGVSQATDPAAYDHYSLLAGLEDRFGLPRLAAAQTATPLPI